MAGAISSGQNPHDDTLNVGFKCNYDLSFVKEVAESINFYLDEYLLDINL